MGLKENFKEFVEVGVDKFEGFLKKVFDSEKSKQGLDKLFNRLREFIGLKTRKDLDDLKNEVSKEGTESIKNTKEKNTLIFGDSIGVGFSVASKKYGGVFEKFVKSGASSSLVLDFLKKYKGDLFGKSVVLMSGFNDLPDGRHGADKALGNIEKSIKLAKRRGGKPVVCSLYEVDYHRIDNEDVVYYNRELKKIAKREGVKYVDLESKLKGQEQPDGLHLNVKGYGLAWDEIRKFI